MKNWWTRCVISWTLIDKLYSVELSWNRIHQHNINMRRNEENVKMYKPARYSGPEEPEATSFLSLLLCSMGMFLQSKLCIWLSIFLLLSSFCRRKNGSSVSQYMVNFVMIIFGLTNTYVLRSYMSKSVSEAPVWWFYTIDDFIPYLSIHMNS